MKNVYFWTDGEYKIVNYADPKTIKVLLPRNSCWNCGECYFEDEKNIYYGIEKLTKIDKKTFKLSQEENYDAEDKYGKLQKGKRLK